MLRRLLTCSSLRLTHLHGRCNLTLLTRGCGVGSPISHQHQLYRVTAALSRFCSSNRTSPHRDDDKDTDDKDKKKKKKDQVEELFHRIRQVVMTAVGFMVGTVLLYNLMDNDSRDDALGKKDLQISWNFFRYELLSKGEVNVIHILSPRERSDDDSSEGIEAEAVIYLHHGAVVSGQPTDMPNFMPNTRPTVYSMHLPNLRKFEEDLRAAEKELGIPATEQIPIRYHNYLPNYVYPLFLLGLLALILYSARRMSPPPRGAKPGQSDSSSSPFDIFGSITKPKYTMVDKTSAFGTGVTFKDVAGLYEAKMEVMEFVDYLKHPDTYTELGARVPKGALLTGPPGCGKTLLARATASEANVPFLATAGSEFVEMIGGLGASRVRRLFKEARSRAPCIIYIDEVDAIGKRRSSGSGGGMGDNSESEQTLNQLLVELDGMGTTKGVICLASTNRETVIDQALLRPGRFDRHIYVGIPTLEERREIFEYSLRQLTLKHDVSEYAARLSHLTPGFSGADIANVCNESAIDAGGRGDKAVDWDNLERAVERIVSGPMRKSHTMAVGERRVVAYREAGRTLVSWLLPEADPVLKVSIVPRTKTMLGSTRFDRGDQVLLSQEQLEARTQVLMAGRAAEVLEFGRETTAAQEDLNQATKLTYKRVRHWGMAPELGLVTFPPEEDDGGGGEGRGKPYSKAYAASVDLHVRQLVADSYFATQKLLEDKKPQLDLLAAALLDKEVLNYKELVELLGEPLDKKDRHIHLDDVKVV